MRRSPQALAVLLELASEVHGELGPGLDGVFYLRALGLALQARGIPYERDRWVEVRFRGTSLGKQQVDLLLEDSAALVVSRAAIQELEMSRLRSILLTSRRSAGAVLNFGLAELEAYELSRNTPQALAFLDDF